MNYPVHLDAYLIKDSFFAVTNCFIVKNVGKCIFDLIEWVKSWGISCGINFPFLTAVKSKGKAQGAN